MVAMIRNRSVLLKKKIMIAFLTRILPGIASFSQNRVSVIKPDDFNNDKVLH